MDTTVSQEAILKDTGAEENKQYTEEFKREIVELVIRSRKKRAQISRETGVSDRNISRWIKEYKNTSANNTETQGRVGGNIMQYKQELHGSNGGKRHPKKSVEHFLPRTRKTLSFMKKHESDHTVVMLCEMMKIKCSSFYAWKKKDIGKRIVEDKELKSMIVLVLKKVIKPIVPRRLQSEPKRWLFSHLQASGTPIDERRRISGKTEPKMASTNNSS